jgi:hypothetical protein
MKKLILMAMAARSLGMAAANAQSSVHLAAIRQSGDQLNFARGGGG